jgi:primosomal protein N'
VGLVHKTFRVALDTPLRRLFDYLPPAPAAGAPEPAPGMRVRVPFGRRRMVGTVLEVADSSELPAERLKPILEVLDPQPLLDAGALELIRWTADYYHHPIGEVLAGTIPRALRLGAAAGETEERWVLTGAGAAAHAAGEPRRAARQRALLALLATAGGSTTAAALDASGGGWREAARELVRRGFASRETVAVDPRIEPARVRACDPSSCRSRTMRSSRFRGASAATVPFSSKGSRAAARPRCTCGSRSVRSPRSARCWCWCRRSG